MWLFSLWLLILAMVVVGGTTRLTGSGLSMVDWHPLMGTVPPLSTADWQAVFERYKSSPQYAQVNHWMQLSDFKRIFFWEYFHRLLGRAVGLWFMVPFVVFLVRGRLRGVWIGRTLVCLLLGGAQGLLGWYMVRSGLVDRPEVSHYRLAAHLSLAFLVGQWVLWLWLDARGDTACGTPRGPAWLRTLAWAFVALLGLQVVWGAFMAGTRAGYLVSSFPDMNGHYLPGAFVRAGQVLHDLHHSPLAIHWAHRALGIAVLLAAFGLWLTVRRSGGEAARRAMRGVLHVTAAQVALGIATVVWHVPIAVAVLHQACAFLLLSAAVRLCHRLRGVSPAFRPAAAPVGPVSGESPPGPESHYPPLPGATPGR